MQIFFIQVIILSPPQRMDAQPPQMGEHNHPKPPCYDYKKNANQNTRSLEKKI